MTTKWQMKVTCVLEKSLMCCALDCNWSQCWAVCIQKINKFYHIMTMMHLCGNLHNDSLWHFWDIDATSLWRKYKEINKDPDNNKEWSAHSESAHRRILWGTKPDEIKLVPRQWWLYSRIILYFLDRDY